MEGVWYIARLAGIVLLVYSVAVVGATSLFSTWPNCLDMDTCMTALLLPCNDVVAALYTSVLVVGDTGLVELLACLEPLLDVFQMGFLSELGLTEEQIDIIKEVELLEQLRCFFSGH